MRFPEQQLWDRLRKHAAGRVHMERVENLVGAGRPDVDTLHAGNFVPLELKRVKEWPRRVSTPVLGREGLNQAQKNWHLTWRQWGGAALIVVGVADEVYAFPGALADELNELNREQFCSKAILNGMDAIIEFLERNASESKSL